MFLYTVEAKIVEYPGMHTIEDVVNVERSHKEKEIPEWEENKIKEGGVTWGA